MRLAVAAAGTVVLLVPFAVLAAMVVGDVDWLHRIDQDVSVTVHDYAVTRPGLVDFMAAWCLAFDPWVWRLGALALVVWLVRRGARPLAWWVAITMAAGGLLGVVLKLLFERHRPSFLDPVASAVGYSFPSGHALNNALGAAVFVLALLPLVRHRPRARLALLIAGVVIPAVTGAFRVGLGVHYVSDVVGGWIFGLAVVAATTTAFLARRRRRATLAAAMAE
ncbi:phosphatase PAP2 family protein [Paractinoplanes deccanensis]|uniref:Phosphatase PAP2 family protein n=1 Tax=Paractinoplanes deccanensis TaxID=113561 RepID=A0ABQ3Y4G1_9ACTN|nr:phosphatase PAP2 family protein [Actinoplanes deccanensis]